MAGLASSKILVVMNDLFFSTKINDCAKRLGMVAEFVKDRTLALEKIKAGTLKKKDSDVVVKEAELTRALDPRAMTEPEKA